MRNLTLKMTGTAGFSSVLILGLWAAAACSSGTTSATGAQEAGATTSTTTSSGSSSGTTTSSSGTTSGSTSGTTSSSGSSSGMVTSGVCVGAGTRMLGLNSSDEFIDDFEEAMISPGWSSFNDVMPTPNSFLIMQVPGGAVGTAHAGHYAGMGAITPTSMPAGYGVGTVYNAAIDPGAGIYCVDITAYDGVSFWAKAGTAGAKISLNYVLPTTNMAMSNDAGVMLGGDCQTNCYNHPRVTVTLTTEWAQYMAPFAMATGGSAKVETVIQELAFLSPDSNWDFSLDEIAFYKGTPPAGPVGAAPAGDQ